MVCCQSKALNDSDCFWLSRHFTRNGVEPAEIPIIHLDGRRQIQRALCLARAGFGVYVSLAGKFRSGSAVSASSYSCLSKASANKSVGKASGSIWKQMLATRRLLCLLLKISRCRSPSTVNVDAADSVSELNSGGAQTFADLLILSGCSRS